MGYLVTVTAECDWTAPGETCVSYGLLESAVEAGVWEGPLARKGDLIKVLNDRDVNGRLPDVVVLTTENTDVPHWEEELWRAWEARAPGEKFKVVPIYHVPSENIETRMMRWARNGALEYLVLGSQVRQSLLTHLDELSREPGFAGFGYEHVRVGIVHPVIDVIDQVYVAEGVHEIPRHEHTMLCRAVVVGQISESRRDYRSLLDDLEKNIEADPDLWGYHWDNNEKEWRPKDELDPTTFKLVLIGDQHPGERFALGNLKNVVQIIVGESQDDFYKVMAYSDVMLTAWWPDAPYYARQVSGGTYRALEVDVPVMVTRAVQKRYTFLDGVSVVRPNSISDMEAIRLFRKYSHFDFTRMSQPAIQQLVSEEYPSRKNVYLQSEVAKMLRNGWRVPSAAFAKQRQNLWAHNRETLDEIINRGMTVLADQMPEMFVA